MNALQGMIVRHLIRIAAIVLFVVTVLAWYRSSMFVDELWYPTRWNDFDIESDRGAISIFCGPVFPQFKELQAEAKFTSELRIATDMWSIDQLREDFLDKSAINHKFVGFQMGHGPLQMGNWKWIAVPYWSIALLDLCVLLLTFRQFRIGVFTRRGFSPLCVSTRNHEDGRQKRSRSGSVSTLIKHEIMDDAPQ